MGFTVMETLPTSAGSFGTIIRAMAETGPQPSLAAQASSPEYSWEGRLANDAGLRAGLVERMAPDMVAEPLGESQPIATEVVWWIDAATCDSPEQVGEHLLRVAERLRMPGSPPSRFWLVVQFGEIAQPPLQLPAWCALSAALRVAQNEYPGIEFRCVGISPGTADLADMVTGEFLRAEDEREIFLTPQDRMVFRLRRGVIEGVGPHASAPGDTVMLGKVKGAARQKLTWLAGPRPEPAAGEVEIEVAASGLNFRDVMWNLGLLPEEALEDGFSGPGLGMECAGTITKIGKGVSDLKPGDRVVAFSQQAFRRHVVTPTFTVAALPSALPFEAAAGIPVAFLTAYYSLVHLGRLTAGETVLIHGGAGAVGLAAIQIGRRLGVRIIATAGSDEKRALLRKAGVDFVCSSRSLSFADEVQEFTEGRGVDLC